MSRFSNIQEILRIPAPELIVSSFVINSSTTGSVHLPLSRKLLLDGVWQLD
jgi:hypothetical protein